MRRALLAALLLAAVAARGAVAAADDCRANFSPERTLREATRTPGRAVGEGLRWELLSYYKWRAFALSDTGACAPLKTLFFRIDTATAPASGDSLCRDLYHRLAFARGFVERSPDLPALCLDDVMSINTSRAADAALMAKYREACAMIVRGDLPVEEMCPKAISLLPIPPKILPKQLRRCVCDFTSLNGRGQCHDDPANDPAGFIGPYRYDSFNALHAAVAAKDPERCGSLELCRGLAGQAAQMAELHRKKAADAVCSGVSAP